MSVTGPAPLRPDVLRPPRCGRYRRSPAPRGRCGRQSGSSSASRDRRRARRPLSPTSARRAAAVIGSWTSVHSRSRSCITCCVDLAVERERGGAGLLGEREEPGPVELRGVEEREQLLVVVVGLAREPDDERRSERRARAPAARIFSIAPRNRSPLPHRFMRRSNGADACCSERSKYGTTVSQLEHRRDQRVAHLGRIEVQQADPRQSDWPRARRAGAGAGRSRRTRRRRVRTRRGPARRGRARTRLVRPGCALRPRSLRVSETVACRGTTGSRRTHTRGRTLRRSSRTPTARTVPGRGSSSRSRTPVGLRLSTTSARAPSPAKPTTASASGSAAASSSP